MEPLFRSSSISILTVSCFLVPTSVEQSFVTSFIFELHVGLPLHTTTFDVLRSIFLALHSPGETDGRWPTLLSYSKLHRVLDRDIYPEGAVPDYCRALSFLSFDATAIRVFLPTASSLLDSFIRPPSRFATIILILNIMSVLAHSVRRRHSQMHSVLFILHRLLQLELRLLDTRHQHRHRTASTSLAHSPHPHSRHSYSHTPTQLISRLAN